jgi:hypothetical protein
MKVCNDCGGTVIIPGTINLICAKCGSRNLSDVPTCKCGAAMEYSIREMKYYCTKCPPNLGEICEPTEHKKEIVDIKTVGQLKTILENHRLDDEVFTSNVSPDNSIYTISPAKSQIGAVIILHKDNENQG